LESARVIYAAWSHPIFRYTWICKDGYWLYRKNFFIGIFE
jgi:hypothetical protein